MTTPDTLALGSEQLSRVTPCAGRRLEWKCYPSSEYIGTRLDGWDVQVMTPGSGPYEWVVSQDNSIHDCRGTEPTAALAQRRCVKVLEALIAPLEGA